MVITQIPPIWTDRDDCFRCRTAFSAFTRKHHCRACGETFCSSCSSKQCPLLEYGMEDEVRVCESCYDRVTATGSVRPPAPATASASASTTKPQGKTQAELDEEDALQLALCMSQSEAEEKERQKKLLTKQYAMFSAQLPAAPPAPLGSAPTADQDDSEQVTSGELAKYLDRNYWEAQTRKDLVTIQPADGTTSLAKQQDPLDKYVRDAEIDSFVGIVTEHINNIKFRMLSNQQRGRNICNDTAVQSVFLILQHMHPELHRFMKSLDDKQAYYESLQDKLSQLKDAREALNALRAEHLEQKQREAFERERQRQIQLAFKLDDMRQKKHAYLEYQRQVHLQRLAEQEAEMQARLDQQRRYAQQREQQNHVDFRLNQMPYAPPPQPAPPVGYHHPTPLTSQPPHSFSMGQLSDVLPPVAPLQPLSQAQHPYSQPSFHYQSPYHHHQFAVHPAASTPMTNEQTLISFD